MSFEHEPKAAEFTAAPEIRKIREMEPSFEGFFRSLGEKWGIVAHRCERCGAPYYADSAQKRCGEFVCMEGSVFLNDEKHPEASSHDIKKRFQAHFESAGYLTARPRDMVNASGTTLFIVGANQAFDPIVFQEEQTTERKISVAQPSIRTQFREVIGKEEGCSTAFVNVATGIVSPSLQEHIQSIDDWMAFLETCGITPKHLQLRLRVDEPDWGGKKFKNIIVDVNYLGIQLGDAVLNKSIPQATRDPITLSDVGFGLERIVWALQKTPQYFSSVLGENLKNENLKELDAIRTLALIAGSGVQPSQKERGYRFRLFAKTAMGLGRQNIHRRFSSSYAYWSDFMDLPRVEEEAWKVLDREIDRNVNLEICQRLGLKKYREFVHEPLELFLKRLREFKGIDRARIQDLIDLYG